MAKKATTKRARGPKGRFIKKTGRQPSRSASYGASTGD